MFILSKIKKNFLKTQRSHETVSRANDEKISLSRAFNINAQGSSNVSMKNIIAGNTFNGITTINFLDEDKKVIDNRIVELRIKEIEKLLYVGDSIKALRGYSQLQTDMLGVKLNTNDKFLILCGIYNCYVNIYGYEKEMEELERKIIELSDSTHFYKFKYLEAVKSFNKQNFKETIELCNESLELNREYTKASILKTIAKTIKKEINYDSGMKIIEKIQNEFSGDCREKANIIAAKGDIAFNSKKYTEALGYYSQAYNEFMLVDYKFSMAMCHYFKAVNEVNDTGYISFNKIDFDELYEAIKLYEAIYKKLKDSDENELLRRMIPFYMNSLQFINKPQQIINIKMKSANLLDLTDENIAIITANAELLLGGITEETIKTLDEKNKLKFKLKELDLEGSYQDIIDILRPNIDQMEQNDESMIAMYLVSLFRVNSNEFIPEFKKYRQKNPKNVVYKLIWIEYLEYKNEIKKAKELLDELIKSSINPIILYCAYKFYKRNSFKDRAFEINTKAINNEYKTISSYLPEYTKDHFFMLIDKKQYKEAENFYNLMNKSIFTDEEKLQLEIEYRRILGQFSTLAEKTLSYYKIKKDYKIALYSSQLFTISNEVSKAIKILQSVKNNGEYEKSELYMQLSQLYIIIGNNELAYKYALKAKEIDKDFHKSKSHQFFITMSIRTNKIDSSLKYIFDFHEEFPKENWIKEVRILKKDEDGKEVLDTKEIDSVVGNSTAYNLIKNALFNYEIGLSSYMHMLKIVDIDSIFNKLRYKKKLIKIAEGHIDKVNSNVEYINNKLLVDALSLYVLGEAKVLHLLDEFDNVFVTYSTVEFLQSILINKENNTIRTILNYISKAINVTVVPVELELVNENNCFLEETMYCLAYSNKFNIPYLTIDFKLKNYFKDSAEFVVDINYVLNCISSHYMQKKDICANIKYSLLKKGYTFINFNAFDLYSKFQELDNYNNIKEDFGVYLSMSRFCDYASFINVYNIFLYKIENETKQENYLKFVEMIFTYLDWYVGRTRLYFYNVEKIFKSNNEKIPFLKSKYFVSKMLLLFNYVDINNNKEFFKKISMEFNYNKLVNIITIIIVGLYEFLFHYKDKPIELKFYGDFLKSRLKYIDNYAIEQIIKKIE